jgi:hypothetical protein
MKALFALYLFVRIFTAVIQRILSMILKFLSTRIFDFEWYNTHPIQGFAYYNHPKHILVNISYLLASFILPILVHIQS